MYLFKLILDNILLLFVISIYYLKLTVLHLHFEVPILKFGLEKSRINKLWILTMSESGPILNSGFIKFNIHIILYFFFYNLILNSVSLIFQ